MWCTSAFLSTGYWPKIDELAAQRTCPGRVCPYELVLAAALQEVVGLSFDVAREKHSGGHLASRLHELANRGVELAESKTSLVADDVVGITILNLAQEAYLCVCVCVCERERERARETKKERKKEREREREQSRGSQRVEQT